MHNNTIPVAFKNCTLLTKCIIKIDGTTIDDAEDLDLIMSMYNLIKYSSNYFHRTGTLWFYSKHEATNFNANIESTLMLLNLSSIILNQKTKSRTEIIKF